MQVEIGSVKLWVRREDLRAASKESSKPEKVTVKFELSKREIPHQLDIRGQYAEDALPVLDKYLLDCYTNGLKYASIIHGKGTGALRVKVREFLDSHPLVKNYADGGANRDDFGSTVAELAQ